MKGNHTNVKLFPKNPVQLMFRVYRYILPEVRSELKQWRLQAERMPDQELRKQAIASMSGKQFHCEGGAVYAAANLPQRHVLIPLIVAFQTISDYLDNLCDRSTSMDPDDFRQLHLAMLDAVHISAPSHDYYLHRKESADEGYLSKLVATCQACIRQLPAYPLVAEEVQTLVSLYCDLQVHKHIQHDVREQQLHAWWMKHQAIYTDLHWNEFAAATGSTLGVFMLFLAAADQHLSVKQVTNIRDAYFPYVCGLHILLDYLIDKEEDRLGGDLNFCSYYENMETAVERIRHMVIQSRNNVAKLDVPPFHRMIIEGLLALYLSDPKVRNQPEVRSISKQLMKNSPMMRIFFWMNTLWVRTTS